MATEKLRRSFDGKSRPSNGIIDLEANGRLDIAHVSPTVKSVTSNGVNPALNLLDSLSQKVICYPSQDSLKIRSTSWLDGVRGVAALGVYLFHAMGCWASLVPGWHQDKDQNNFFQLPLIRTFFVSGGAAVSLFFAISGYVLTYRSLRWIREGSSDKVYSAVASSSFRRGFRLYLPPILLTFCEMIATRFGFTPPLNFSFTPEPTFFGQFLDWLSATNQLINPVYNLKKSLQGFGVHPKYDSVVWTIPLEFYGSFVCYSLLLVLSLVPKHGVRMGLIGTFSGICMVWGSWNLSCFSAGMLIADLNLGQDEKETVTTPRRRVAWVTLFMFAFYLAGFPTLGTTHAKYEPMPGFGFIKYLTPKHMNMEDYSRFWWSISGISLLLSISQVSELKGVFESRFCQYLGKISFSLYLVHEFSLVLLGLRYQALLKSITGVDSEARLLGYWVVCAFWFASFSVVIFAVAGRVEKWVDAPSVRFAKWLEGKCLKLLK